MMLIVQAVLLSQSGQTRRQIDEVAQTTASPTIKPAAIAGVGKIATTTR